MKQGTKTALKFWGAAILVVILALFIYRASSFAGCVVDEMDLKRDTHFNWITGNCTTDTPKGRVYTKSLRGFDGME